MKIKTDRLLLYLLAGLFIAGGLLAAVLLTASPAQAAAYQWEDTRGPGNGSAEALLYVGDREELYRGTVFRGVWSDGVRPHHFFVTFSRWWLAVC